MTDPTWPTVREAVILSGRSKTVIYDLIASGQVRSQESTDGIVVDLAQLRQVIATKKRGRPRKGAEPVRAPTPIARHDPIVYYLRFGNRCKIGTTTRLLGRMSEVINDELIAWEPGGADVEAKRHRQFAASLVPGQKEWFEWSDELALHLVKLQLQRDPTALIERLRRAA